MELEQFCRKVIEHPSVWRQCKETDSSGQVILRDRGHGDGSRNMYDANNHIVMPEAAVVDASYAELFANYGPAAVFISHVWAEKAECTEAAVKKLREWVMSRKFARTSLNFKDDGTDSNDSECRLGFRVYFCVLCNNQSRVKEELGDDVKVSPFASVLGTSFCGQVAMISPLRALERKWCNYEFCLARQLSKQVWMITADGVVQAGQVAPRALVDMANKVMQFHCKDATCFSIADHDFIDRAVEDMGGYQEQDNILKEVFRTAIFDAHSVLDNAVVTLGSSRTIAQGRTSPMQSPDVQDLADLLSEHGRGRELRQRSLTNARTSASSPEVNMTYISSRCMRTISAPPIDPQSSAGSHFGGCSFATSGSLPVDISPTEAKASLAMVAEIPPTMVGQHGELDGRDEVDLPRNGFSYTVPL